MIAFAKSGYLLCLNPKKTVINPLHLQYFMASKPSKDRIVDPYAFDEKAVSEFLDLLHQNRPTRKEAKGIELLAAYLAASPHSQIREIVSQYDYIQMDTNGKIRFSNKPAGLIKGRHKQPIPKGIAFETSTSNLEKISNAIDQQKTPKAKIKRIFKKTLVFATAAALGALVAEGAAFSPQFYSRIMANRAYNRAKENAPDLRPFRLEHDRLTPAERKAVNPRDMDAYQYYTDVDRNTQKVRAAGQKIYWPAAAAGGAFLALRRRPRLLRKIQHRPGRK